MIGFGCGLTKSNKEDIFIDPAFADAKGQATRQQTLPHYIENTGDADLRFLEMFKARRFQDLSLSEWLTHTLREPVIAHLNIDRAAYDAIPREKRVIVPR